MFQTPQCARHLLAQNAELMRSPRDTDEAVAARMRRQKVLYQPEKLFRVLLWEGALHALICPPDVMAGQVDRLVGLLGVSTVQLGVVPFGAQPPLTAKHGFWIFDEARVIVEAISTELRHVRRVSATSDP
ncbi:Scr1 family TA system antitoxin-like transcriptional regulator [Streptomyces xantholiticus]|uniref:Scr1 family TA system antitoxin-like transcriptional regulator n=1 Tax=Streptomyces xantholiticus TaxID=68285 RepID=UPI003D9F7A4E